MKVIKNSDIRLEEAASKLFVGQVNSQHLIDEKAGQGLRIGLVKFSPGAKTLYHTHTCEQVLYITDGKGIVATEKEEFVATPGMLVYIPPGERHWHGATQDTSFAHLSIQMPGKTEF